MHPDDTIPEVEPYRPAGQGAVHALLVNPAVEPYRPAGQLSHTLAPASAYLPGPHRLAVELVLPWGQA